MLQSTMLNWIEVAWLIWPRLKTIYSKIITPCLITPLCGTAIACDTLLNREGCFTTSIGLKTQRWPGRIIISVFFERSIATLGSGTITRDSEITRRHCELICNRCLEPVVQLVLHRFYLFINDQRLILRDRLLDIMRDHRCSPSIMNGWEVNLSASFDRRAR